MTRWIPAVALCAVALIAADRAPAEPAQESAASQYASLKSAIREARGHHQDKAYLDHARALYLLLNGSPTATMDLAAAELATGRTPAAMQDLQTLARMGQSYGLVLKGAPFAAARKQRDFPALAKTMAKNAEPLNAAERVFDLHPAELVPEDIDYDPDGARFFISSVLQHEVLAFTRSGTSTPFASSPHGWPMMGLKVDAKRHRLWVSEVNLGKSQSAVLIYELPSGRLLHRLDGPPQTDLGDLCLTPQGDAIVSDGGHGGVYRVHADTLQFERLDAGEFVSPQTPALAPNGWQLWVPDYARGIGLLDMKAKSVTWLGMQNRYALSGVDGLYFYEGSLLVTQNGTSPERVARFRLNEARTDITSESIIERATPTLGDPTHGVVVGEYFYYLANSGWDALDDEAHKKPDQVMTSALLMRTKLSR